MFIVRYVPGPWYWFDDKTVTTQMIHAGEFTVSELEELFPYYNVRGGILFYTVIPVDSNHHKSLLKL